MALVASALHAAACSQFADATSAGTTSSGDEAEDEDDGESGHDATTNAPSIGRGLPCDVEDVVDRHCTGCHDEMPIYGAPMSLYDDAAWRVPAHGDPTITVAAMAAMRIVDEDSPMPASGPMPPDDLAVLQAWIDAGTPSDDGSCGGGGGSGSDSGSGSESGSDTDPYDPPDPADLPCEVNVEFTAHDGDAPFHVPAEGVDNLYQCFTFASPVAAESQAIAWAPIIDDERVVHHWVLYRTASALAEGSAPCNVPGDAAILATWAPGGGVYEFPDDVGLGLRGSEGSFILQVHYNNSANYADVYDRSGIGLCVVDEPREHTAGLLTLGTRNISIPADAPSHEEVGMCPSHLTSAMPEPLHVLSTFMHMHELGASMRTEILRGGEDGPAELLAEVANYDIENQNNVLVEPEILIEPGDALRTTCTWANEGGEAVEFGLDSEDEMCFDFVMVWPIDAYGGNQECIQ